MESILERGEKEGLIKFIYNDKGEPSSVEYVHQGKTRSFKNPEEKVQAEAFCRLVLEYGYPVENIRLMVVVKLGVDITKEADIVVYKDKTENKPYIIVECKKEDISEAGFKEAINQAFSYAHGMAVTTKYVWVTSGIKNEYFKYDKESEAKENEADLPRFGSDRVTLYKFGKNGGKNKDGELTRPLEKISESALTSKFKQAHQALWAGGELNPSEAFDELDKLIFCKIWDEKAKRKNGEPYDFQIIKVETDIPKNISDEEKKKLLEKADKEANLQLWNRLNKLYEDGKLFGGRKNDTEIFKDGIKLNPAKVRTVVGYLENVDLLGTDLDSKGRAFETFMGSFFRGDFGQYFTPRSIVSFIVDSLPIEETHKVLDTSCGSGGFLLHALDKIRRQAWKEHNYNPNSGEEESAKCHTQWHDFAEYNLFGIEINEQISRTAKMNMIIHDDGHTNVVTSDGLISPADLRHKTNNLGFKENSFNFILTNPPFGSTVKAIEKSYLKDFSLGQKEDDWLSSTKKKLSDKERFRPSQSTEVLFIEQAERYLAEDGYLGIVLPDGILTNSSMQYVRDYIGETFRIVAVVSMPQTAFASNGAGVKSSVLFLKKYSAEKKNKIKKDKIKIQDELINNSVEGKELDETIKIKKLKLDEISKEIKNAEKNGQTEIEIENLKIKKQEISDEFDEKIENLKETLTEMFNVQYKKAVGEYPIFMAIAEDIGFDATGKETGKNELIKIGEEISKFIKAIENGKDKSFI